MEMKICIRCKEPKEATLEFFSPDKRVASGLSGWCRTCTNKYNRENYKSTKKGLEDDGTRTKVYIPPREANTVPILLVNMFKDHSYSIETPRNGKGTTARILRGKVIQETDKLIILKTKNYIESFSKWELAKCKIMEV